MQKKPWRYPVTHVYHKWRSCDVWFLKCKARQTEFFVILGHFLALTLLTTWKIKVLKNEKNTRRYYHFTFAYHKWWSYEVWFLRYRGQQNFLSFWTIFCPFTPPSPSLGDTIISHKCTINDNHMIHDSWDMKHDRHNFLSFWTIFCLLPH